jgi:pyruvate dehydrogenase E1 component beta subunit
LKVILPATPHDAKGMLLAAIADNNPVLCIEHRWLFGIEGPVPETTYRVPLGVARVIRPGRDLTIAAVSHSTIDALRAAEILAAEGIDAEVLDLRTLRPLDRSAIVESVRKTGRLLAADIGWKAFGAAAEVMAVAVEGAFASLKAAPVRVGLADCPSPSTPALAKHFFPRVGDIVNAARRQLGRPEAPLPEAPDDPPADVPDHRFRGPF